MKNLTTREEVEGVLEALLGNEGLKARYTYVNFENEKVFIVLEFAFGHATRPEMRKFYRYEFLVEPEDEAIVKAVGYMLNNDVDALSFERDQTIPKKKDEAWSWSRLTSVLEDTTPITPSPTTQWMPRYLGTSSIIMTTPPYTTATIGDDLTSFSPYSRPNTNQGR